MFGIHSCLYNHHHQILLMRMKLTYDSYIQRSGDFSNSIADSAGVRPRITGLGECNSENGTSVHRSECRFGSGRGHPGIVRRGCTSGRAVEIQSLPFLMTTSVLRLGLMNWGGAG